MTRGVGSRACLLLAPALTLLLGACGGSGSRLPAPPSDWSGASEAAAPEAESAEADAADAISEQARATMERCGELSALLASVADSGSEDLMMTAFYAVDENYPACRQAAEQVPGEFARRAAELGVDAMLLHALHVAATAAYLEEDMPQGCTLARRGAALVAELRQGADVMAEDFPSGREGQVATQFQQAMASESRFFMGAESMFCDAAAEATAAP